MQINPSHRVSRPIFIYVICETQASDEKDASVDNFQISSSVILEVPQAPVKMMLFRSKKKEAFKLVVKCQLRAVRWCAVGVDPVQNDKRKTSFVRDMYACSGLAVRSSWCCVIQIN